MEILAEVAVSNALLAVPLAVVARLIGWWSQRPALEHALWVLVLLKLVTPPLIPVSLPEARLAREDARITTAQATPQNEPELPAPIDDVQRKLGEAHLFAVPTATRQSPSRARHLPSVRQVAPPPGLVTRSARSSHATSPPKRQPHTATTLGAGPESVPSSTSRWLEVGMLLWIGGAVLLLLRDLGAMLRFHRALALASPASHDMQQSVARLAHRLGLRHEPDVRMVRGALSPMVWPLGRRATLLLPRDLMRQLSPGQREALLAHELAHLRRRDHWVRGLELVVRSLYWWHPLLWWAQARLHQTAEEACDAWVTWAQPGDHQAYAQAILHTLDFLAGANVAPLPPTANGLGQVKPLKRRLAMIMQGSPPKSVSALGWVLVLVTGLVLLPWTPTMAKDEEGSDNRPAKVRREIRKEVRIRGDVSGMLHAIGQLLVDGKVEEARDLAQRVRHLQHQREEEQEHQRHQEEKEEVIIRRIVTDRDEGHREEHKHARREPHAEHHPQEMQLELQEEIQSKVRELQEELADAAEEIRQEVAESLEELPRELLRELNDLDVAEAIEDLSADLPRGLRTFVADLDLGELVEDSLSHANDETRSPGERVSPSDAREFREQWHGQMEDQMAELHEEFQRGVAEVRREIASALREVPRELRSALAEIDVPALAHEALSDAPPVLQEFFAEVDVERTVDEALDAFDEAVEGQLAWMEERKEVRREDDRRREGGREQRLERRIHRLESQLDRLLTEFRAVREELSGRNEEIEVDFVWVSDDEHEEAGGHRERHGHDDDEHHEGERDDDHHEHDEEDEDGHDHEEDEDE